MRLHWVLRSDDGEKFHLSHHRHLSYQWAVTPDPARPEQHQSARLLDSRDALAEKPLPGRTVWIWVMPASMNRRNHEFRIDGLNDRSARRSGIESIGRVAQIKLRQIIVPSAMAIW
jgi:hypothetical protein